MKDLRIVIVSWNVEKLLERCLRSLPAACQNLEWDVVVVDNASRDESVARAREMGELHGLPFTVIANEKNVGFAKACNQGIAGYEARYVVLLNPDTECPAGSLAELVRVADTQPKAGIVGPKLIYPDGRYQESVRRFPTVWSQLSILLRFHWFASWLPTLRRYFHRDLDVSKEQAVDQVMGACFLIRRELIEEVGALDERYFIWFEEVDYCKMAVMKGWDVVYAPSATVIHHGGQSFGQLFSRAKQGMFNDSMLKYFQKWHPGWRAVLLRVAMPISSAVASFMDALRTKKCGWIFWLIGIAAFEVLSRATVFHPDARKLATLAVGIIIALIAARKPSWALSALLLELLVGSKGALLKIPDGMEVDGGTSLRVTMFAAFLAGWFLNALGYWVVARRKIFTTLREAVKGRAAWFAVGGLCIWAAVQGQWLHNQAFFQDGNAWFFLILLIPIIDIARRDGRVLLSSGTAVVIAALIWLPLKTLGLLYIFSHGIPSLSQPTYLWVRRTGVGEVTLVTGNLFRIFMQSQIYALIAWIVFAARAAVQPRKQMGKVYMAIGIGSVMSILVSLSRSFWIGLAAGGLALLVLMWREWKPTFLAWCGRLLIPVGIVSVPAR
jgi:N-acetylglucosaminyl-diphospho-decaprenol L-rhamnosyltransferase